MGKYILWYKFQRGLENIKNWILNFRKEPVKKPGSISAREDPKRAGDIFQANAQNKGR
jgi:hypothetical protein